MPSPVITAALQAGSLSATSNVLAQALAAFRHEKPFQLNPIPVFQFALFNFLNTPPNYAWQQFLENTYPGYTDQGKPHDDKDIEKASAKTLNVKNTFTKFFLDQTLGATVNTILFSLAIGIMKGLSVSEILGVIQRTLIESQDSARNRVRSAN
ncbi:MAG: hypothetical protein M1834_007419 [Cirrosporium novae-zelandiae]|nr:MAG: hypothetical protein M1834_007419 [Cirrosporium novae-zelandiae]